MKRKEIIILLWGLWFFSLIGMVFCVFWYISQKQSRLHSEIRENVENLFDGQWKPNGGLIDNYDGLFYATFNGSPVRHYKQVPIGAKPRIGSLAEIGIKVDPKIEEKTLNDWEDSYGDLSSMYELNWRDEYPNQEDEGWNIIRICCHGTDDDFIQTNIIFPYKVGMKKTEWGNYFTVEQAVNMAYQFYTTNANSGFSDRFHNGSISHLWSKIYDCNNDYYSIVENDNYSGWRVGIPIYQPKDIGYEDAQRLSPYENGWMHNGYFRVFIAATQEKHYMIQENEWAISGDRKDLLFWWGLGLSTFFLILIIPLSLKERQSSKRKSETLYQRLCRMCNPSNFMKDYNKEKVDKANEIYQRLMEMKSDDKETLMSLQEEAVSSLGIELIDAEEYDDLIEKVYPQQFMNPYNAEKIKIANDLYSRLTKEGLTYEEFVLIKEESKAL